MLAVTVLVFLGLLLVLVLVHEWGHLVVAKWSGCRVEEFGFGFPPRLISVTWHDTRYSLNLVPLGGFVRIEGEDMTEPHPPPTSFAARSPGARLLILSAGVAMNVALALVLLTLQAGIGFPTAVTPENSSQLLDQRSYIMSVAPGSPAEAAHLAPLSQVKRIADVVQPRVEDIQRITQTHLGVPVDVTVSSNGGQRTVTLVPRPNPPPGEGPLGISLQAVGLTRVPWWQAPLVGAKRAVGMLVTTIQHLIQALADVVGTGSFTGSIIGPVGIAGYVHEATQLGMSYVLELTALISLNLALINVLPFPALDGGRMVFTALEKLTGHRVPVKWEQWTHTVGFALLIALMLVITYRDIGRVL